MKHYMRVLFVVTVLAVFVIPAFGAEQAYRGAGVAFSTNVANCKVSAGGIGSVTATFFYYWDVAAQHNIVASIMNVSSNLKSGYYGSASKSQTSVTVRIKSNYGSHVASKTCSV